MKGDVPAAMRYSRKPRNMQSFDSQVTDALRGQSGRQHHSRNMQSFDSQVTAWYYIEPSGLDVYVSTKKGEASTLSFRITRQQIERALEIIKQEDSK